MHRAMKWTLSYRGRKFTLTFLGPLAGSLNITDKNRLTRKGYKFQSLHILPEWMEWPEWEAFISFKQRNNKLVTNWQDQEVWALGSKQWRSHREDKREFNEVCVYRFLDSRLPPLVWEHLPSSWFWEGTCHMCVLRFVSGKSGKEGKVRVTFLLLPF